MTVKSMTAEEDGVAVEVEPYGELNDGQIYNQEYHTLMEIRDRKISRVREYVDRQRAANVWFRR